MEYGTQNWVQRPALHEKLGFPGTFRADDRLFGQVPELSGKIDFSGKAIIGPSGRLPINDHHFTRQLFSDGLDPGYEAVLHLRWVEADENIAEGVVGWDAVGQFQEGLKPGQLALAEELDMHPRIGAADGGASGDGNDVHQFMASGAFHQWVVQPSIMIQNSCLGCLCHAHMPPHPSVVHSTLSYF